MANQSTHAFVVALTLCLMACGGGGAKDSPTDTPKGFDASVATGAGDAGTQPQRSDDGAVLPGNPGKSDAALPTAADGAVENTLLYDPNVIHDVQITLAANDWSTLVSEGHTPDEIYSGCQNADFAYTKFPATVTVDGQQFMQVAVRKKGFLGSLSVRKPSLRLDFDEYISSQAVDGAKALTLNNGREDPAVIRECLGYELFNRVGVPASRCSFARVTVNGQLLGLYSNIEPIKKPLMRRLYGEGEGNLYEGSLPADFREDLLKNFEKKTNEADTTKPELEAITAALAKPDDTVIDALGALVDFDAYAKFWAAETLLADFDGYNGNQNNFYVYGHPDTGKISFLPWGIDSIFDKNAWTSRGRPVSALASSYLANRLYAIPDSREVYQQTLRDLLTMHWNETELLAEVSRMAALVGTNADAAALDEVRSFIGGRRAELTADLDKPYVPWEFVANPSGLPVTCRTELNTAISGKFATTWLSEATANVPGNSITMTLDGAPLPAVTVAYSSASPQPGASALTAVGLQIMLTLADKSQIQLQFLIGRDNLVVGDIKMHGLETFGTLLQQKPGSTDLAQRGVVSNGTLHITKAGSNKGDPIEGSFEGVFTLPY